MNVNVQLPPTQRKARGGGVSSNAGKHHLIGFSLGHFSRTKLCFAPTKYLSVKVETSSSHHLAEWYVEDSTEKGEMPVVHML